MRIRHIEAKPLGASLTRITISVSGDRAEIFREVGKVIDGLKALPNGDMARPYDLILKPYYPNKSNKQLAAIWAKIHEIAYAVGNTDDGIYLLLLRRYAPSSLYRTDEHGVKDLRQDYRIVDITDYRKADNTYFCRCYKGLSKMTTQEAAHFLDGVLDECKEIGISTEIKE